MTGSSASRCSSSHAGSRPSHDHAHRTGRAATPAGPQPELPPALVRRERQRARQRDHLDTAPLVAVVGFDAGPGWMGILTAAAWVPWLVVGLPAGAWVDRLPARRVMIVSDLAAGVALASVPVAGLFHLLTLPQLAIVAFVN